MLKTVGNPSTRSGDQTIVDGNLVFATAGKGIDFSATSSAGSSELFDDYEEGTFTPTFIATTTDFTSVTYAIAAGSYTKIGRQVFCQVTIRTSAIIAGAAAGNIAVGNLPFVSASSMNATPSENNLAVSQNFTTANPTHGVMYGGWNFIAFQLGNANTYATVANANTGPSPANTAFFNFSYFTET